MILTRSLLIPLLTGVFVSSQHHHGVPEPSPSHINQPNRKYGGEVKHVGRKKEYIHNDTADENVFLHGGNTYKADGNVLQHGENKYKGANDLARKYSAGGEFNTQHGNGKIRDDGKSQSSSSRTGKKSASKSSNSEEVRTISSSKNIGTKSGMSDQLAKNKTHKKDYVLTDSIQYGFDKKFDQDEEQDGAYKSIKHSDSHSLDDYFDKHKDFQSKKDSSAKSSDSIGSQRGLRESSESANSGSNAIKMGYYFGKRNNRKQQGTHANMFGSKLDFSTGGRKFARSNGDALSKSTNDFSVRNKNSASDKIQRGQQGGAFDGETNKGYRHQRAGKQSHNLITGASLVGQSSKVVAGVGLRNGKYLSGESNNFNSGLNKGYASANNQRNHQEGKYKDAEFHGDMVNRSKNKQKSSKEKDAKNRQYADASKFYKNNDSANSKHQHLRGSVNAKKKLTDRVHNDNESKTFHTSKKIKGNNYERLVFDRKKFEKDRAKDALFKSSDGKKYRSKSREVDNKGKHYTGSKSTARQNNNFKDVNKKSHAASKSQENTSGAKRFKADDAGQFAIDRFGEGFSGFGHKAAVGIENAGKGKQNQRFAHADSGHKDSEFFQMAAHNPPQYRRRGHPVVADKVRKFGFGMDFDFHQPSFGIPSINAGSPRFHNPFGSSYRSTFRRYPGAALTGRRLSKEQHLEIAKRKPRQNRVHDNHKPKIIPQPRSHNELYGNYESLSMANLFEESAFGRNHFLSPFSGFKK